MAAATLQVQLITLGLCAAAAMPVSAAQDQDGERELFPELDPYTKGERELEKALGYERYGFIPWRHTADSKQVQMNMGGAPMLWVETAHFRIGSSLGTYELPNDRPERKRIKEELDRLEEKLGRLKAPKRELDPHLRLHIWAQRAEDLYDAFVEDFGLESAFPETTYLGHPDKFRLLLCERKSDFGRYLRTYEPMETEFSYRTGWRGEGMFVIANIEAVAEYWEDEDEAPLDTMFHCIVTHNLANNFVDGFRSQDPFRCPTWMVYAAGHHFTRQVDERYPWFDGRKVIYDRFDDSWDWEPRVRNLVGNDFFASAQEMFAWTEYEQMHPRDHIVSWSKLEYLLGEVEGDPQAFLRALCTPLKRVDAEQEPVTRQTQALETAFGLTPAELDAGWSKWVKKTYRKK